MRGVWTILAAASWPAMAASQQAPAPTPAPARAAQASEPAVSDEPDIIVQGQRNLPGSVIGDIPPEQQLGPADIRSYGVSSVADLLTELGPQTRSGVGGAPVVLLDGKRIAGFQEIRDIPTEAIARVDILPEEVALKYGYRADQKVVNIVLRRRFRATTVELADRQATEGGRNSPQADLDRLQIRNGGRFNLHSEYQQSSALTEAERNIALASTDASTTTMPVDQRAFRTLQPFSRDFSSNVVYARPVGKVSVTINGRIEAQQTRGLNGLAGGVIGGDVLGQRNDTITGHLGTTLNAPLGGSWNASLTGGYDRVHTRTASDTGSFDNRAVSDSSTGQADLLINGTAFSLPAGAVSTSVRIGASTSDFDSRSYRVAGLQTGSVSRDIVNGRVNVDVPIASRSKAVLGWLGNFSLNGNAAVDQLSDFGTLTTIGYGANWAPIEGVRLIGSVSDQDEAPSAQQLGNPLVTTPNVRVFDYVQGQTATVTTVTGGNAALIANSRHVTKLGLTLTPWHGQDLTLTANYTKTSIDDPIAAFPAATAAIEAAFPRRFTRDAGGNLTRIDTRPINFARSERSELRWGINFSKPLKSKIQKEIEAFRNGTGPNPFAGLRFPGQGQRRPGQGADGAAAAGTTGTGTPPVNGTPPPANGAPPAGGDAAPGGARGQAGAGPGGGFGGGGFGGGGFGGGGGRGGGGFGGGRGAQGGGRLQFALYHTWHLTDRVLVADGGPSLDLLNGDAIGASGGQSRHELEGQAGYVNNGLGVRLSVNYASGTRVDGGTPANPEPLRFSALTTANLRLFADLGGRLEWIKAHPWLRGTRFTLSLDNLFDSRQRVTDSTGTTPISYQPDYLDPLGRTVRVSLRKLFF